MALPDAIRALADHWSDVHARLGDQARRRLASLVQEFGEHADDPAAQEYTAVEIVELLWPLLPDDHPVRLAMTGDDEPTRLTRVSPKWAPITETLLRRIDAANRPTPEAIVEGAVEWLLAMPALSAAEVRGRGQDPDHPELIRLERGDGVVQLPAFQFDAAGRPIQIVLTVNRLLGAEDDPWGAADWWLGPNAWLGAVPADLIGQVDENVLLATAKAVVVEG
jgi:hypothetical protein